MPPHREVLRLYPYAAFVMYVGFDLPKFPPSYLLQRGKFMVNTAAALQKRIRDDLKGALELRRGPIHREYSRGNGRESQWNQQRSTRS